MRGCVPKKLLIYGACYGEELEDARSYGWTVDGALDWAALIEAKDRELDRLEGVYGGILRRNNVELIDGKAVPRTRTPSRSGAVLYCRRILVACGGWPTLPNIPGIEHAIT